MLLTTDQGVQLFENRREQLIVGAVELIAQGVVIQEAGRACKCVVEPSFCIVAAPVRDAIACRPVRSCAHPRVADPCFERGLLHCCALPRCERIESEDVKWCSRVDLHPVAGVQRLREAGPGAT